MVGQLEGGGGLNKAELKRVQAWLWSIRKTEISIENLRKSLSDLETRKESPPTWMSQLRLIAVPGGGEEESKQEAWAIFLDEYPGRKSYLEDLIEQRTEKVRLYNQTMEELALEEKWGYLGAQIINAKYYRKIRPDKAIYSTCLFCTPETYYRAHRRAVQFFWEVLPHLFQRKNDSLLTVNYQ
jgi:hypothetical protein